MNLSLPMRTVTVPLEANGTLGVQLPTRLSSNKGEESPESLIP